MSQSDQRILEVAGAQHGVVHRSQLRALGVTQRMVERRRASGLLVQISPKVDVVAGWPDAFERRLMAATLQTRGVASHRAAAQLHRIPMVERGVVEVSMTNRHHHPTDLAIVHLSMWLVPGQVCVVDGIPTTTLTRTVLDLGLMVRFARMRRIIESLVIANRLDLTAFRRDFEAQARQGRNGTVMIREVLDTLAPDLGALGSTLEARFLEFIDRYRFPRPVQQYPLPWRSPRDGFVDHAFVDERVLVELDSRTWHSSGDSLESDRERDLQAQAHGWAPMRVTGGQLDGSPTLVADALGRLLGRRAA